ncbi:hypothetical protein F5144DRAFT_634547 [Chaetomium tenue]|uniref:Uncharacterized protein n=1 Tax=Chaetomium tenue TaxID=1854479 RepID=A0ACB7PLY9_9PEZI|nr:hypothetical protein F5144DRAFT_634547 [Chaetomium globosum]
MHQLQIFKHAAGLFLLLAIYSLPGALGNKNRKDLCGVSMHTSNIPGVGNFSAIDATWRVPEVAGRPGDNPNSFTWPHVKHGVALCCGDDCSTKLSASILVSAPDPGRGYMASAMFELSPAFPTLVIPEAHNFYINSSDVIWMRAEILDSHTAQLTFSKFVDNNSNITVSVNLGIGTQDGKTILNVTTRSNEQNRQYTQPLRGNHETPEFCGDSAWWWFTDYSADGDKAGNQKACSRFAPVLVAGQGLQTTEKKVFPADLALSGLARFWNMVRDTADGPELLCSTKSFVDTGMTMFYPPHPWGV